MSIEQIKREFPFLWQAFPHYQLSLDATIDVRVSRLSLDTFELPMEEVREPDYVIERTLYAVDERGRCVCADGCLSGKIYSTGNTAETIGDVVLRYFSISDGEEWARNVSYLIYVVEVESSKWRRIKGAKKSHREWDTKRFEAVIFKMPKSKTLWQLVQRYRKNKRVALRH